MQRARRLCRIGQAHDFQHFLLLALARQTAQPHRRRATGGQRVRLHVSLGRQAKVKAEIAQNPQIIFLNARRRIADKAHMASLNIGQPVPRRVVQRAISIGIKRVNGEVAPRRIALPILGEGNLGMAAIRGHINPQSRDFIHQRRVALIKNGRHSAVLNAGRHGFDARLFQPRHNRLRRQIGRHINLGLSRGEAH